MVLLANCFFIQCKLEKLDCGYLAKGEYGKTWTKLRTHLKNFKNFKLLKFRSNIGQIDSREMHQVEDQDPFI